MSHLEPPTAATCHEQVYLIDRDAGLLCRILGLYAARAMDVLQVDYALVADEVMRLRVRLGRGALGTHEAADSVRVLVAKASTFVGVMEAAEQRAEVSRRRETSAV